MNDQDITVIPVSVGDHVIVVDENYAEHHALVVAVHGSFEQFTPCINVIYVSGDAEKSDPYGRQIERYSSLQHFNATHGMPKRGRYWRNA